MTAAVAKALVVIIVIWTVALLTVLAALAAIAGTLTSWHRWCRRRREGEWFAREADDLVAEAEDICLIAAINDPRGELRAEFERRARERRQRR